MNNKLSYDNIVVINTQTTCWEDQQPIDEESEIILISVCLLSVNTLRTHSPSCFVIKPTKSSISDFCYEITGLTQAAVNNGIHLHKALEAISSKFNIKNRVAACYGLFPEELKNHFNNRQINIQSMLPIVFNLKEELDLVEAAEVSGIEYEGELYDVKNNAINASRVLAEIIRGGIAHK